MPELSESLRVEVSLKEAWEFYFDSRCWPAWVEGFGSVESAQGYPEDDGRLVWRSTPAGRGRVEERVLEHTPRTRHRIAFTDPQSEGELETRFAVEGEATRVSLTVEYRLVGPRVLAWVTERLFVRGQVRRSLQRTLVRLKHEAEEAVELGGLDEALTRHDK